MMGRAADCGVMSVTVVVADPALEADTPIGLRTQAPVVGLVSKDAVEAPGPAVSREPIPAGAQTGNPAPAGQGLPRPWVPQPPHGGTFAASLTAKHQLVLAPTAPSRAPPTGRAVDAVQPVQPTPEPRGWCSSAAGSSGQPWALSRRWARLARSLG